MVLMYHSSATAGCPKPSFSTLKFEVPGFSYKIRDTVSAGVSLQLLVDFPMSGLMAVPAAALQQAGHWVGSMPLCTICTGPQLDVNVQISLVFDHIVSAFFYYGPVVALSL